MRSARDRLVSMVTDEQETSLICHVGRIALCILSV